MKTTLSFLLSVCLFLTLDSAAQSQRQWSNWYFGNSAGIEFSGAAPTALVDGALSASHVAATISDASGQLLFYTDGESVWDRNHNLMPNGNGLDGDNSSYFAGALIVPKPGSATGFYIFTHDIGGAIDYTEVNMALNSGLGNVPGGKKNISLTTGFVGGKMTAVRHSNGSHFWLLVNTPTGDILAYEFGPGGLLGSVISNAYNTYGPTFGTLCSNADGTKLALAPEDGFDGYEDYLLFVLMDFDPATGQVTASQNFTGSLWEQSYGVAFSPDGSKLYRSRQAISPIVQYDLAAGSPTAVLASATPLGPAGDYGEMQIGPDGKIYVAENGADYLHVINRPDSAGTAAFFQYDYIYLAGKYSTYSLPLFPPSLYHPSCQYVEAPSGLSTVDNGLTLSFNWDAVPNTVGCQVRGRPFSSTTFATRNVPGFEADELEIPWSILAPGEIYLWQTRCACALSPLDVTDWSFIDIFTSPTPSPAPRQSLPTALRFYPNPAIGHLNLQSEGGLLRLISMQGEISLQSKIASGAQLLNLDGMPPGMYLLELEMSNGETLHQSLQINR